jgi:hypothetical protein
MRTRPRVSSTVVAVLVVVVLSLESVAVYAPESSDLITVGFSEVHSRTGLLTATFELSSTRGSIAAHVALVPGNLSAIARPRILMFSDPGFPLRYWSPIDQAGFLPRLELSLGGFGSPFSVQSVNATSLPAELNQSPNAMLIDFGYGALPLSVLSSTSTLLKDWLAHGGTLVWGGGPLAYYEAQVGPGGTLRYASLGWSGQLDLLGFPLEDEIGYPSTGSRGPLVSTAPSPLGAALGISYDGTPDGANTTELTLHGGSILGTLSPAPSPTHPESERTSLAYVPVGLGGVFYFGGALWGTGVGLVPSGAVELASDVALIAALQYVPRNGTPSFQDITMDPFARVQVTLSVQSGSEPYFVLVSSQVTQTYLFIWKAALA